MSEKNEEKIKVKYLEPVEYLRALKKSEKADQQVEKETIKEIEL